MMPVEREFVSPDFCYQGTLLACAEMIRSVHDPDGGHVHYEAEIARAVAEAGLRGVLGESVLKFPSPDAESYDASLAYTRQFIEAWKGHPPHHPGGRADAPYTNTAEILRACTELAKEFDVPLLYSHRRNPPGSGGQPPRTRRQGCQLGQRSRPALRQGACRALRPHRPGRDADHAPSRDARGAQSDQQPQARQRDRPDSGDARSRPQGGHRHGRNGQQQRPRHVRRDASGCVPGQRLDRRSDRPPRPPGAHHGHPDGRGSALPGRHHRQP